MRLITFNIAYGTGAPKSMSGNILSAHRYLRARPRNMDKISRFVTSYKPDLVALVEVDTGSFRSRFINQAHLLAERLGSYRYTEIKYENGSFGRKIPIMRMQANSILSKLGQPEVRYHFLPSGVKRLVIELRLEQFHLFLVHLALQAQTRRAQIDMLHELIANSEKPCIVTGDFNTLRAGERELDSFCRVLHLVNANSAGTPTFPTWSPDKQLDFILCSETVKIRSFKIPDVRCSDHLPLVLDFDT